MRITFWHLHRVFILYIVHLLVILYMTVTYFTGMPCREANIYYENFLLLVRKPEGNWLQYLEHPDMYERIILKLTLINFTGMICEDLNWFNRYSFLNTVIKFQSSYGMRNVLTSWATVHISRRTLCRGIRCGNFSFHSFVGKTLKYFRKIILRTFTSTLADTSI